MRARTIQTAKAHYRRKDSLASGGGVSVSHLYTKKRSVSVDNSSKTLLPGQFFRTGIRLTEARVQSPAAAARDSRSGLCYKGEGARMNRDAERLCFSGGEMDTCKAAEHRIDRRVRGDIVLDIELDYLFCGDSGGVRNRNTCILTVC